MLGKYTWISGGLILCEMFCWAGAEMSLLPCSVGQACTPGVRTQMNTDLPCVGKAGIIAAGRSRGNLIPSALKGSVPLRPQRRRCSQT